MSVSGSDLSGLQLPPGSMQPRPGLLRSAAASATLPVPGILAAGEHAAQVAQDPVHALRLPDGFRDADSPRTDLRHGPLLCG